LRRRPEQRGVVITLVAVVMLCVIGAMAALSIDVVTLYTARSEAQLVADAAALAGARMIANSGATSDPTGTLMAGAQPIAQAIAIQVGQNSMVGGRYLIAANGEITVSFIGTTTSPCPMTNPCVTVRVQRTDLPTFFARIWGRAQLAVAATATAEAYNPSSFSVSTAGGATTPVAPICVKPWLLPNMDPSVAAGSIFDPTTGLVATTTLLGWSFNSPAPNTGQSMSLSLRCEAPGNTCVTPLSPLPWNYFPGDDATTFPHPTSSLPACSPALTTNYQNSIAGCIQVPISCNSQANIDMTAYNGSRDSDTADAVNCLTHATNSKGDTMGLTNYPTLSAPFQFVAGADNPVPGLSGSSEIVSDSLVTVPVFDISPLTFSTANPTVQIIGFVQLFLNPLGTSAVAGAVNATVINLAGCGTSASGQPILGNGASPVAVRLISLQ
jgi:hypothetical protein